MNYPKANIVKDKKYLRWVQQQPCIVNNCSCTNQDTVVPHHIEGGGRRSDDKVVPLCHYHHLGCVQNGQSESIHFMSREKFEAKFGVDLEIEADRLYRSYKNKEDL